MGAMIPRAAFASCTLFATGSYRMSWFLIHRDIIACREKGRGAEKIRDNAFRPIHSATDLEPHPNANCYKPSRLHCFLVERRRPDLKLHETDPSFIWRTL